MRRAYFRRRGALALLCALGAGCLRTGFSEPPRERIWFVEAHRVVAYDADRDALVYLGLDAELIRPQRVERHRDGSFWVSQSTGPLRRVNSDLEVVWSSPPEVVVDPFDMVLSEQGVWVSDRYRHTVSRISDQGDELCRATGGPTWPTDLVAGRDGAVWVREGADWLRTADLFLIGADCQQLVAPVAVFGVNGMAADGEGGLWVAESGLQAVLRVSETGAISADSRDAGLALGSPWGLALDASGRIWVGDIATSQVSVLDPGDLSLLAQTEAGAHPGVRFMLGAEDGSIWLIEDYGSKVSQLRLGGSGVEQVSASGEGLLCTATDLLPLAEGGVLVVDNGCDRLLQLTAWGTLARQSDTGFYGFVQEAVASPAGQVWIADRARGLTSRLDVIGMQTTVFQHGSLRQPFALAAAADGSLWVADQRSGHLFLLAADGTLTMNLQLGGVWATALHGDGASLWVALSSPRTLVRVDQRGQQLAQVDWPTSQGSVKSMCYEPDRDALWVLDSAQRLVLFSTAGAELYSSAGPYSDIAPALGGGIWAATASSEGTPIIRLDDSGAVVAASRFFAAGRCVGEVATSLEGGVWVVDTCQDAIVLLDQDAREVERWGGGVLSRPITVIERTPSPSR